MKAENLKLLRENNFNVPPFITVSSYKAIDLTFSNADLFAVRSSFDGEDGGRHSFAGQYDTFLNVPRDNVPQAVRSVLKSRIKARVYAAANGLRPVDGCVIIQEMIAADISGVLFTANPNGILNETVVTAGIGTGDRIVNDSTETTTYFYNNDDKCWYRENGNDILKPSVLSQLLENAEKAKRLIGKYLDMEFAVKDGVLYILQVRPITTLSPKKIITLDSSNISESYPGITLPLTQSFVRDIYYRIFNGCLWRMSRDKRLSDTMRPYLKNMVTNVNGHEYYLISNWYAFLSLLPFSHKIIPVWQEMLGIDEKSFTAPQIKTDITQKAKILLSFIYYLVFAPAKMHRLKKRFEKRLPLYERAAKKSDITSLLSAFDAICRDILNDWDITLINDMYAFIFTSLCKNRDIKNISPESIRPVRALNGLIATYRKYGINSKEYKAKRDRYIALYGDRISGELKLETATYRTCPILLDKYVKTHMPVESPKYKDTKRSLFEACAAKGIAGRESSRLDRSRIFGIVRSIMLRIGEILTEKEMLEKREDVFYLYLSELRNIDGYSRLMLKNTISQRKQKYSTCESIPYFKRLVFADKIIEKNIACRTASSSGKALYGSGVSAGKVRGEIIVVDDPTAVKADNKIIVTHSTDPGWVFLIQNCRGIISERGSLLSHTAIISRELKKPSVVNVKNAAEILKNGMYVELDADRGRIMIL